MIKLIAFDMDGTFLRSDNTYDVKRFECLYEKAKQWGIHIVPISGNQYFQISSFFQKYQNEITIASENGALIFEGKKLIKDASFDEKMIRDVLKEIQKLDLERFVLLSGEKAGYVLKDADRKFKEESSIYYHKIIELSSFEKLPNDKIVKFAMIFKENMADKIVEDLQKVCSGRGNAVNSGQGAVDINLLNVNKGTAIKYLASRWQIDPSEIMAFGDSPNDIEMLEFAENSYAMKNADPRAKQAAKFVTKFTNNEDGVLDIIENVALKD